MAKIISLIQCTIDPLRPVEEVGDVIGAVLTGYDAPARLRILNELEQLIDRTRTDLQPKPKPETTA